MEVSLEKSKISVNEFSNRHTSVITMIGETLENSRKIQISGIYIEKRRKKVKRRYK